MQALSPSHPSSSLICLFHIPTGMCSVEISHANVLGLILFFKIISFVCGRLKPSLLHTKRPCQERKPHCWYEKECEAHVPGPMQACGQLAQVIYTS